MKKRIHINQHIIKSNNKTGKRAKVITVKTYNSNTYANKVEIKGPSEIVYSPSKPCHAGLVYGSRLIALSYWTKR